MLSLARDRALVAVIVLTATEFGVEAVMAGWGAAYALAVLPTVAAGLVVTMYWTGLRRRTTAGPARSGSPIEADHGRNRAGFSP